MSAIKTGSPKPPQSIRSSDSPNPAVQIKSGFDDKPTTDLAQRLLAPTPSTPLPPLFPTPTADLALLNQQIYHFLALALRAFVLSWWSKLTPRDRDLLPQITIVLQHVIRKIFQRLQRANLAHAILVSLPIIIKQHYADFRQAQDKAGSSYGNVSPSNLEQIFHRIQPHIAIRLPDGSESGEPTDPRRLVDPVYLTACVDLVLRECLPLEDSRSDMERCIVREIIVGPVLGGVLPKLAQPWFINTILLDLVRSPTSDGLPSADSSPGRRLSFSTFQSLTVMVLTAIQTISTFFLNVIHFSQSMVQLANAVNADHAGPPAQTRRQALQRLFSSPNKLDLPDAPRGLAYPTLELLRELVGVNCRSRETFLLQNVFNSVEMIVAFGEPFFDRLLPHLLKSKILTARTASTVVTASTRSLFPNGYPGPPPLIPTSDEQVRMRKELDDRLKELIPGFLRGPDTVSDILDPLLTSAECNMHLIIRILDLVLVTLFPEFAIGGSGMAVDLDSGMVTPMLNEEEVVF